MTLRKFGDPILKQPAEHVPADVDVSDLVAEMRAALDNWKGIGLSAQQVGRTERVALMTLGGVVHVAINLKIVHRSKANVLSTHEGCLSVRTNGRIFRMNVKRSARVLAEWEDEKRQKHCQWLGGINAIIAQHEAEHLDGKCIVDRLTPAQLQRLQAIA